MRDSDGQPVHFIVHVEDISVRKRMEASLQRLADHDPLTDLWNRRRFEEELRRQVARCQRYGEKAALLLMDLDGFKAVNDTFGHKAGDDLLKLVAAALSAACAAPTPWRDWAATSSPCSSATSHPIRRPSSPSSSTRS